MAVSTGLRARRAITVRDHVRHCRMRIGEPVRHAEEIGDIGRGESLRAAGYVLQASVVGCATGAASASGRRTTCGVLRRIRRGWSARVGRAARTTGTSAAAGAAAATARIHWIGPQRQNGRARGLRGRSIGRGCGRILRGDCECKRPRERNARDRKTCYLNAIEFHVPPTRQSGPRTIPHAALAVKMVEALDFSAKKDGWLLPYPQGVIGGLARFKREHVVFHTAAVPFDGALLDE